VNFQYRLENVFEGKPELLVDVVVYSAWRLVAILYLDCVNDHVLQGAA